LGTNGAILAGNRDFFHHYQRSNQTSNVWDSLLEETRFPKPEFGSHSGPRSGVELIVGDGLLLH
jgi:hypothetical protein